MSLKFVQYLQLALEDLVGLCHLFHLYPLSLLKGPRGMVQFKDGKNDANIRTCNVATISFFLLSCQITHPCQTQVVPPPSPQTHIICTCVPGNPSKPGIPGKPCGPRIPMGPYKIKGSDEGTRLTVCTYW